MRRRSQPLTIRIPLTDFAAICRIRDIIIRILQKQKWTLHLSAQSRASSTADVVVSALAIELYEYDTKKLDDTAKEIVAQIKENNSFTIIEGHPVNGAYLSVNGRYLMIYNDKRIDKEKPDKNSNEYKARESAVEDFLAFKK